MTPRGGIRTALLAAATGLILVASATTSPAAKPEAGAAATGISVDVKNVKGAVDLLKKVQVEGALTAPLSADQVQITVSASGRELFTKKVTPKSNGAFGLGFVVNACCRYVVEAENAGNRATDNFSVSVPRKLSKGGVTALFNKSLQDQGFHTGTKGGNATMGTRLAIKAFRKTNGMARSESYKASIFRTLLQGRGAFNPQFDDGAHVEVDISRQVMSLIEGDTPVHTFHVSTGASSTPTVRGNFRFYMKQSGYNAKQMYYSVYFIGGYATHGYNPVPNSPASHGCVRNPIPFSRFIYNWVDIGMPIHVYG